VEVTGSWLALGMGVASVRPRRVGTPWACALIHSGTFGRDSVREDNLAEGPLVSCDHRKVEHMCSEM
jgi:hypothetical protein